MNSLKLNVYLNKAEDSGHTCLICREGYLYKSEEVLGVYVYYKKILLGISYLLLFLLVQIYY
jgi:hypothetical protein